MSALRGFGFAVVVGALLLPACTAVRPPRRVPGMAHCAGGPATDEFDLLTPLVDWVERGQAPDQVVAQARGGGNAVGANRDVPSNWAPNRGRPLCPYPAVARLRSGATDLERPDSFTCSARW